MIQPLCLLLVCQLAGEALVRFAGVAFPGPVLGMGLLVVGLLVLGRAGPALEGLADGILKNLSLLFVPAAVGIVQQAGLIAAHWVAITLAVVVSTVATLIVTVLTFRGVVRLQGGVRS